MFNIADWILRWPRSVFVSEIQAVEHMGHSDLELVFEEAFTDRAPLDALIAARGPTASLLVEDLLLRIDQVRSAAARRQHFSQRRGGPAPPLLRFEAVTTEFVRLIEAWFEAGYFELAMPKGCVDAPDAPSVSPGHALELALGQPGLWPLWKSRADWSEDSFFDLVEVFDEMIARPRHRSWHSWNQCGWHTTQHAKSSGQSLYRHELNLLLDRSELAYRVAISGDDAGLVVTRGPDVLRELAESVASRPESDVDPRRHAIALFRSRSATRHDKRSAVVALANVLEERRDLIKAEMLSKDEGALFQIANQFAIRHQGAAQMADYQEEYLDWIFWWYLATLEMTDAILRQRSVDPPRGAPPEGSQ